MSKLPVYLVTGSRTFPDIDVVSRWARSIVPAILIHGAARGVDRAAGAAFWTRAGQVKNGLRGAVERFPPAYDVHGGRAPLVRNAGMVDRARWYRGRGHKVLVVAFPHGEARGTLHTVRLALEAGLPVSVWRDGAFEREPSLALPESLSAKCPDLICRSCGWTGDLEDAYYRAPTSFLCPRAGCGAEVETFAAETFEREQKRGGP